MLSRLGILTVSVVEGRNNTLYRRLFVVEILPDGQKRLRQSTLFLDLVSAEGLSLQGDIPTAAREEIEAFLISKALQNFLKEFQEDWQKGLEIIAQHVELSLNSLIDRQ
ncbi:hypothetical protein EM20IM_06135 [Candidatus Methylacidiphilum infernorum]|uniref:Uncharacterized protein n=1 Tax=Candidatus Methylacidiphilum infernorum TaxID=511746 RepID=A0ABX7PSX9_9BACT|nr:hypothetical protein [Candidatus Methylacidiphilum infernorum]QSR86090.1 hypothetical protein EM20IM_06135 [Candidatus Methylacidiphilum infernorum]